MKREHLMTTIGNVKIGRARARAVQGCRANQISVALPPWSGPIHSKSSDGLSDAWYASANREELDSEWLASVVDQY